jgi:hypothetical protein
MAKDRVSLPNQALEAETFLRTIISYEDSHRWIHSMNQGPPFALIAGPVLVP